MRLEVTLTAREIAKALGQHVVDTMGLNGAYEVDVKLKGVKKDEGDDEFTAFVTVRKKGVLG